MAYKRTSPMPIVEGGTNATSMTNANGVVYFDGTVLNTTAVGSSTDVLTSNGPGMAPTFQASGGGGGASNFITDSGTATESAGDINVNGDGVNINTSGSGDSVVVALNSTVDISGNFQTTAGNLLLPQVDFADFNQGCILSGGQPFLIPWVTNVYLGLGVGNASVSASYNIGIGNTIFPSIDAGQNNIAMGYGACNDIDNGSNNIAIGASPLESCTEGSNNIAIGAALGALVLGNYNIVIGNNDAGSNYSGSESSNILISNEGVASESHVIRIGTTGSGDSQQNTCYIAGIGGVNVGSTATIVTEASDQLGTAVLTPGTGISITPTANTITIATASSVSNAFDTDSGNATPSSGVIHISGGSNINTAGATDVVTVNLNNSVSISGNYTTTAGNILLPNTNAAGTEGVIEFNSTRFIHNVGTENTFVGSGSGNLSITGDQNTAVGYQALTPTVAGSGNIAVGYLALHSVGASANNNIALGNSTGGSTTGSTNIYIGNSAGSVYTGTENNNIVIGNTGVIGDVDQIYLGTEGTHTDVRAAGYMHADALSILPANVAGTTGVISIQTARNTYEPFISSTLDGSSNATNLFVGVGSGNIGQITGGANTALGTGSGDSISLTSESTYIGYFSGFDNDGAQNTFVGSGTGASLTAGTNNIIIGYDGGSTYTSTESSNILIGNIGVNAEANVIHIGTQGSSAGQQNVCYIAGIYGGTVGVMNSPVLIDNTGLLGTLTSSRRFKDNIEDMDDKSSPIMDLRPVTFTWKKDPDNHEQWGLIAEEVEDVFPALVNYDDEGSPFSVKYHDLTVMLLNEIQKLSHRLDENEETIRDLKEGKRVCRCSK